jgi:hypothetical protein
LIHVFASALLFLARMTSGPVLVGAIHLVGFGVDSWQFWTLFAAATFWMVSFAYGLV